MHRLQELVRLHRMGSCGREVARMLGMSPNTERSYRLALDRAGILRGDAAALPDLAVLRDAVLAEKPPRKAPQQASSLEHYTEQVRAMSELGAGPTAIFDRLRLEDADFGGSLAAVKRLYASIRADRGVLAEDVVIPVETEPGHVAQVDFGYVGFLYDANEGRMRKGYVFVLVLGFSRHMFARIVFDQKVETWLRLHIEAFEDFGGVPSVIVPDNLKAAVVRAAFGLDEQTSLNRSYRELARHYGFKVDPAPVASPEKKGKVEAGVKYVKRNFFLPREERDAAALQRQLIEWVREIAGTRTHGTTQRQPLHVYEQLERATMQELPARRAELVVWKQAKVHRDTHIVFRKALYSVPWRFIGKEVWVRACGHSVLLYVDDTRVAEHESALPGKRSTKVEHLPEYRSDLRERSQAFWENRAARMGDVVLTYVREVFQSDDVLDQLRVVQAIVTHLEKFPEQRARAACARARFYANYTYPGIRNILRKALDLQPLPTVTVADEQGSELPRFRFARDVRELLEQPLEVTHEPN
ncbi:MAG TPA: IS21 family transposase [Polyangiales bacterium]|nr:IS21 family transposase [Polyangiales bacterium]